MDFYFMMRRWKLTLISVAVVALGLFIGRRSKVDVERSYVEIGERVEVFMKRRCENTSGECTSMSTSMWDFEEGAKGYPSEEDSEWSKVRQTICGQGDGSAFHELPKVTSTTLLNRRVEVPYDLPSEFLLICNVDQKHNVVGALFRKNTLQLLRRIEISRLLNAEVSGQIWLWSLDRERNVLLSSTAERT